MVRTGTVTSAENISEVCFHRQACGLVIFKTPQLREAPLPAAGEGGNEVLECLSLNHHRILAYLAGLVSGGKAKKKIEIRP